MNKTTRKRPITRATAVGQTWWGKRWIEALEHSSRDVVARLGKGRVYARDGHVHDLKIQSGKVITTVSDDELDSYLVSLQLEVFSASTWQQILRTMSGQAMFAAQLLNGEMPREIDRLFHNYGKSLFPTNLHDIDADCSCEDWSSPCKHVAATHYVLGEALDRDPFLLFELRGRSKEQLLSALSQLRSGQSQLPPRMIETAAIAHDGVALRELSSTNFEQMMVPDLGGFNFDALPIAGALLRSLGKPASWTLTESPQELLAPIVAQARKLAIDLASEANPQWHRLPAVSDKPVAAKKPKACSKRQPQAGDVKSKSHP
ncbi:MAG: hypothetical protein AB7F79_04540 [Steroidobacteraceae bacterium]